MADLAELLKAPGAAVEAADDFDAANELVNERGWGDGLPVVPPTAARVAAMLAWCDRPWDQPIAAVAPRYDMSTFGAPSKYSYVVAENEAASPWEPLHVERGLPADSSAVTVVGAECPHNVNDHESITAEGILTTIAGTMATTGANDIYYESQPVVVMGPEHARTVADGGLSKLDAKRFLQSHAHLPLGKFSKENIERRFRVAFKERYGSAGLDAPVYAVRRAEDILIVVIGGAGKHSAYIPTFGATRAVTRALKRRNGSYARSVADFQRR